MPEDHQNERPKSPPEGDERTPDKTMGQVKYAAGQMKKTNLEPEKPGGIGGP